MEVAYETAKLAQLLADPRSLRRAYGAAVAKRLATRLSSIAAVGSLHELGTMPGRLHPLKGDRAGQFAMDLPDGWRLILKPAQPVPLLPDGGIDLRAVTAVTIADISRHYQP